MLCSHCKNNDANTHITKVINGAKEEMFLCEECARDLGMLDEFEFEPFSIDGFFGNLLGSGVSAFNSLVGTNRCSYCGSSLQDIIDSGKVGCSHCYEKFEDRLLPNIRRIHGDVKHLGKSITYSEVPDNETDDKSNSSLESLKEALRQAIKEQRFEDAAVLRDKIKEITKED